MSAPSFTVFAMLLTLSGVARAEPAAEEKAKAEKAEAGKEEADKGEADKEKATGEKKSQPPDWLRAGRSGAAGAPAKTPPPTTLPPDLFGRARFALPKGGEDEEREGIPLGDDESWKVHATQIGLMVGGFAALTALCQGGGCMLPKGLTGWLPDPLKAKPYQAPQIDQPSEYRKSR